MFCLCDSAGVLTQISISFGILVAQGISIPLSTPGTGSWRYIPLASAGIALVQVSLLIPCSPDVILVKIAEFSLTTKQNS